MASASSRNLAFDLESNQAPLSRPLPPVVINGKTLSVTPVFNAYWYFAAERQEIFFKRLKRTNGRLTADPILEKFKFTNAYRASDRVSQYLIKRVIYRDDLPTDPVNIFFRTLLFKLFNKIETWELLERTFGALTWNDFSYDRYDEVLAKAMMSGTRIYSAAYIMPSAGSKFGHPLKHQNHLRLIEHLIGLEFPQRLQNCKSMSASFDKLLSAPSVGPFLAYQYATDLNYSNLTNFGEDEFVVAGPGALDGIEKCFTGAETISAADIIKYMRDNQDRYFAHLDLEFKSLWGRQLQLIDCQNLFCEISKYSRVAFPQFTGVSGRTRIKQKFACGGQLSSPWYPPKWKLNEKIERELLL